MRIRLYKHLAPTKELGGDVMVTLISGDEIIISERRAKVLDTIWSNGLVMRGYPDKILAVRVIREFYPEMGLKEAKDTLEAMFEG
jgi:hypothetical protein